MIIRHKRTSTPSLGLQRPFDLQTLALQFFPTKATLQITWSHRVGFTFRIDPAGEAWWRRGASLNPSSVLRFSYPPASLAIVPVSKLWGRTLGNGDH